MTQEIQQSSNQVPMTPGFGVAGQTMCPFGFQKGPCMKQACELWVELEYPGKGKVARCAIAWQAILMTEQTSVIKSFNTPPPGKKA